MIDRLLMPTLTFVVLIAAPIAFAADLTAHRLPTQRVVQLERVVIVAQRSMPALQLVRAEPLRAATSVVAR
jgi:BarA-like signal transduction histidine kinase